MQGLYPLISMTIGRCRKRTKRTRNQKPETRNSKPMSECATEEKTSDFRCRTSAESGGRRLRWPYGARVVASRGLELEVTIRGSGTLAASALARHCEATGVSLLYLTIDGVVYIPCYDNNGNVTRYLNVNGGTFARYSYDAFGRLIARAGRRASFFRHRFSTKYFDTETGLYYYGYRFYHPGLMRWLNRDPIGEEGGANLLIFCNNSLMASYDLYGCFAVEYYSLKSSSELDDVVYKSLSTVDDVAVRNEMIKPSTPDRSLMPVSSANGVFHQELTYIDSCIARIRVEINLNAELESTMRKGDLYAYWPHPENGTSKESRTSLEEKSHRRPPKGGVLAHERGHAEVFVTLTKPRFENYISSYLSKKALTFEEKDEVKALFAKAQHDTIGESGKRANVNTVLWFQANGFSVTRRKSGGSLRPNAEDPYEFIKR